WYNIDATAFYRNTSRLPGNMKGEDIQNRFVMPIAPRDVFPNYSEKLGDMQLRSMDLAFFPSERGPYNFNPNLNPDGTLPDPKASWASITREIRSDIDFDNANMQYLEFW